MQHCQKSLLCLTLAFLDCKENIWHSWTKGFFPLPDSTEIQYSPSRGVLWISAFSTDIKCFLPTGQTSKTWYCPHNQVTCHQQTSCTDDKTRREHCCVFSLQLMKSRSTSWSICWYQPVRQFPRRLLTGSLLFQLHRETQQLQHAHYWCEDALWLCSC